jgi:hypothetical protein
MWGQEVRMLRTPPIAAAALLGLALWATISAAAPQTAIERPFSAGGSAELDLSAGEYFAELRNAPCANPTGFAPQANNLLSTFVTCGASPIGLASSQHGSGQYSAPLYG